MWQYKREESTGFDRVPVGKHRIRVKSAEKAVSKNGNDMLALQFDVSGIPATLYHYIVFMDAHPEITNRMLTQFFDSFAGIKDGDFDLSHWIGHVGACNVAQDKNDPERTRLTYFIPADKQDDLPPWKNPNGQAAPKLDGFERVDDNPFF